MKTLLREKPVVCVVHGFQAALIAWPTALLLRKTKWIYMHRITKARTKAALVFKVLYWPFHVVAGNSQSVARSLAPLTSGSKLLTLDNGINLERFDRSAIVGDMNELPCDTRKVIVSVGRLLPQKGQSMLIDAFDLVAARYEDVSLLIIGDGPMRKHLQEQISDSPF